MKEVNIGEVVRIAKKIGGFEMQIAESEGDGGKKAFELTILVRQLYRDLNRAIDNV